MVDEQCALHKLTSVKAGENALTPKIESLALKALSPYDALFRKPMHGLFSPSNNLDSLFEGCLKDNF